MTKLVSWILVFISLSFISGCGPSTNEIGTQIAASMQNKFNSDTQLRDLHLTVQSVTVVHSSGNLYQGIARISSRRISHDIPVKITADGQNTMWETEPGALLTFLADDVSSLLTPTRSTNTTSTPTTPISPETLSTTPDISASVNGATDSHVYATSVGVGLHYINYPRGYMVDDLCSTKMANFCYAHGWRPWLKELEITTAGDESNALAADTGAESPGNVVISWDSEQRVVFSGFRPHDSTSASAYLIVAPKTRMMDIIWQRGDKITYLGPDSAFLRNAHAYEWLEHVEQTINNENAKAYEQAHP
jgi:hypothetical protein